MSLGRADALAKDVIRTVTFDLHRSIAPCVIDRLPPRRALLARHAVLVFAFLFRAGRLLGERANGCVVREDVVVGHPRGDGEDDERDRVADAAAHAVQHIPEYAARAMRKVTAFFFLAAACGGPSTDSVTPT